MALAGPSALLSSPRRPSFPRRREPKPGPRGKAGAGISSHRRLLRLVDVDVLPEPAHHGMAPVADHPRVSEVVVEAVDPQAPRRIHEEDAVHLAVERGALGAVGHELRLLVELVELRLVEARMV